MIALIKRQLSHYGTPSRGDRWLATRAEYKLLGGS